MSDSFLEVQHLTKHFPLHNDIFSRLSGKTHTLKAVDADFKQAYYSEAELYALGAFPADNATMSFDEMVSMFNAGNAAMITLPSDQLGKIIGQPNEKDYVFNWGITFPASMRQDCPGPSRSCVILPAPSRSRICAATTPSRQ